MGLGDSTGHQKLNRGEIASLARTVPREMLEKALDRAQEKVSGEDALALATVSRPVDQSFDPSQLPDGALDALGRVILDLACEKALESGDETTAAPAAAPVPALPAGAEGAPLPPSVEPVVDFDETGTFTGKVWSPDTREGSFRTFFDSSAEVARDEFMRRFPMPFLMSPVSVDQATWTHAVVLPVSKKNDEDTSNQVTLGRDDTNDIVAKHASVSRRHAVFSLVEGRWFVTDLGSANGTKIEGQTIKPNVPVRIRDIVQLDFGDARLTFNMPDHLFHFIEQIKKLHGPKVTAKRPLAPLLDDLHERQTSAPAGVIVPVKKPVVPAAPTQKFGRTETRRVDPKKVTSPARPAAPPPAPAKSAQTAGFLKERWERMGGLGALFGTPKRIAITIGTIALVIFVGIYWGDTILYLALGDEKYYAWRVKK